MTLQLVKTIPAPGRKEKIRHLMYNNAPAEELLPKNFKQTLLSTPTDVNTQ